MKSRYDTFSLLILNINRSIQRIKNYEMTNLGLKGNQVQCIYHLFTEEDGISPSKLSKLCGEDKGAMSRTIKDLEKGGFLFTEESENKKYKNPIKLTEKGRAVGEIIIDKIDEFLSLASKGIKEEEREKFYNQLSMVEKNLKNICNSYIDKD